MGRKREMSQWLLEDVSPRLRQCGDVIARRWETEEGDSVHRDWAEDSSGCSGQAGARGRHAMGAERLTRVPPRGLTQLGISNPGPVVSMLPDLPFYYKRIQKSSSVLGNLLTP